MSAPFWATANLAFNDEERAAFNKWRTEMYHTADLLRDQVRMIRVNGQNPSAMPALELAEDLMSKISSIPSLVL
jgi:hypothetical protein